MGGGGGGEGEKDKGDGLLQILSGRTKVLKSPPPKFFNSFLLILVVQRYFFAHSRNSTVGNTGFDTAGLMHVHLLILLGWCMCIFL